MLLFVYGTLRRGEANHAHLDDARFVRTACTEPRYELVDLGGYPALLEDGSTAVIGELYEIDSSRLERLDAFEDVPTLYQRKSIRLADIEAEVYVMERDRAHRAPRIVDGDWSTSRSDRRSQ